MDTEINQLTEQIIGAAIEIHKDLGPGLLESAYQKAVAHEFRLRKLPCEEQKLCAVRYKDLPIEGGYRLDFPVDQGVVVEIQAIDALLNVHAQVLTYVRFSPCRIGLLLNFRTTLFTKYGLKRLARWPLCRSSAFSMANSSFSFS